MSNQDFITITIYEEDDEVEHQLPSKMAVCHDCEGHGMVLNEAMRNHGYSSEEFNESFDEEEAEHYFRRGGMYDVICPTCKGKNVVQVVDEDACKLDPELEKILEIWKEQESNSYDDGTDRMERMMGC